MDRLPAPRSWTDPPLTLVAALLWAGLLIVAACLRRRAPYLLFGVVFFLVGHLVESSFVGLELFFAHRNYLPSFGIYFALVFSLHNLPASYQRFRALALTAYIFFFALVLLQATTAWGDPDVAAELWYEHNPYSERVVQFLATQSLARGDPVGARKILDDAGRRSPSLAVIQIQRTQLCVGQEQRFPELLAEVTDKLRVADFQQNAVIELSRIVKGDVRDLCPPP